MDFTGENRSVVAGGMIDGHAPGPRADVVERAVKIRPVLRANAEQADHDRMLPPATVDALLDNELINLMVPRRFGGLQCNVRTYVDTVIEIARGDSSAGWYGFILNCAGWVTGMYPEAAQKEVWGKNPKAITSSILAPTATATPVEGGVRLTGEWAFASGCRHANWAQVAYPILEDGAMVDTGLALVPIEEMTFKDTWFMAGMSGTRSDTIATRATFVPDHRILRMSQWLSRETLTEYQDEAEYRTCNKVALQVMTVPPVLGIAQAALDETLERLKAAPGKRIAYSYVTDSRTFSGTQSSVARAAILIDSAILQTRRWADEMDVYAQRDEAFPLLEQTKAQMSTAFAIRSCQEAMRLLLNVQGASSFASSNPMQRLWRDFEVASRHGLLNAELIEDVYGKALLGVTDDTLTPLM
jgi:alkylation response protein AidB-like acyl-CoA dehydrogenase